MEAHARRDGADNGPDERPRPVEPDRTAADPEARAGTAAATHPDERALAVMRELECAAKGLLVRSESDEPLLPWAWWPGGEAGVTFSPAALAARYGAELVKEKDDDNGDDDGDDGDGDEAEAEATAPFTVGPLEPWFERAARAAATPDEAERLRALCARMRALLTGRACVRIGAVGGEDAAGRIGVYLVGAVRGAEGDEEEGDEEGVFPPGARIVGLETAQVET